MKALRYILIGVLLITLALLTKVAFGTIFTSTIDTATPAGSDAPSVIDNRIREAKAGWQERLNVDHAMQLTGTQISDANVGEHRKITLASPIEEPTTATNKMFLYGFNVDDLIEFHIKDESGNIIQFTSAGEIPFASLGNIANDTAFSAVDNAGTGTVDLIKADTNDVAVLEDDSQTETDAAPTFSKSLTNKKYVDAAPANAMTPATYAGEESVTYANGLIHKTGSVSIAQDSSQSVSFAEAFPTSLQHVILTEQLATLDIDGTGLLAYTDAATTGFTIRKGTNETTTVHWFAIGY